MINQTLSLYDKKNIFLICPNFNGYLKNGNNKIIHNNTFIKYIFFFINIFKSIKKEKKFLFHLRGFPSSLVFFIFKMFKKINYIYDPRGLYIDEINESKKKIRLFSPIFRIIEKKIINNSIFVIVTSNKFKKKLYKLYKTNKEMLILYNSSFFYKKNKIKKNKIPINYVYCGSFNYWHDVNILKKLISYTKRLYALNSKKIPNFYIICNYKNHNGLNDISIKLNIKKKNILKLKNNKIDHFLKKMDVGLAPLKDLPSKNWITN